MEADDDDDEILDALGEFTLEDTYAHLKEYEKKLLEQLDELRIVLANNKVETLPPIVTPEIMKDKKCRMLQSMIENIDGEDIEVKPFPNTLDSYYDTISALEEEVLNMKQVSEAQMLQKINTENNIAFLEKEKRNIQLIREANLNAIEDVVNSTYDDEITAAKKVFNAVKSDLAEVVSIVMPNNRKFEELLGSLTAAYFKGGDGIYIDVERDKTAAAEFLIESDVAMYHPNDKTRIRMMDLI